MKRSTRLLLALAITVLAVAPGVGHAEPTRPWACAGEAPATKTCIATHEISVQGALFVFVYPVFGQYTGRIRITLSQGAANLVDMYCDYVGDAVTDIDGDSVSGTACKTVANAFPGEGATFTQRCYSYNKGTFTLGGDGLWTCGIIAA